MSRRSSTCLREKVLGPGAHRARNARPESPRHADRCDGAPGDRLRGPPPVTSHHRDRAGQRSLDGLLAGLDDQRFEVRYHCSRAMVRILTRHPELSIHPARVIAIVRAGIVSTPQRWRGYKLLDRPESDTPGEAA